MVPAFFANALIALAVIGGESPPSPSVKSGDSVVVMAEDAALMRGSEAVKVLSKGQRLTVEQVSGDWLGMYVLVDGERKGGWIHLDKVLNAGDAVIVVEESAPLMSGKQVVATLSKGKQFVVADIAQDSLGTWLAAFVVVDGDRKSGWVHLDKVSMASASDTRPSKQPTVEAEDKPAAQPQTPERDSADKTAQSPMPPARTEVPPAEPGPPKHSFQKFVLYDIRLIHDAKLDGYGVVARIAATEASAFEKIGLRATLLKLSSVPTDDLADLKFVDRTFNVTRSEGKTLSFTYGVRAPKSGVSGQAQSADGMAHWSGTRGVIAAAFEGSFFDAKSLGFVLRGEGFNPVSNIVLLTKEDSKPGDVDSVFKAVKASVTASDQPAEQQAKEQANPSASATRQSIQNTPNPAVREGIFVFVVPPGLARMALAKLERLKTEMLATGRQLAVSSQTADPALFKEEYLTFFAGYETQDGALQIILTGEELPVTMEREKMFALNVERIEWGKKNGHLSEQSAGAQKLEVDGVPALLMDITSVAGERLQTYTLFHPSYPKRSFAIGVKFKKGEYSKHENSARAFFDALKVNIGGK